ncbi:hypothetical protein BDZ91DRAFT_844125 [Kalaharituber pfeilii]|nr:hypothetical protein BDZ91DRAFT_844125 [Kalaharituber pfeilii]
MMESSSKVTVMYWDPSSVFPLIEHDLRAHLPLRNLHWKAPNRPLRSISTLHVELVPYTGNNGSGASGATLAPPIASDGRRGSVNTGGGGGGSGGGGGYGGTAAGSKRRRHQIPGLRNTPYLKVYILRCDDNDSYKSTSRKLLREWVSTHGAANSGGSAGGAGGGGGGGSGSSSSLPSGVGGSGGGDGGGSVGELAAGKGHDAAEWLIIHVLLPGTAAYAQPRAQFHPPGGQPTTRGWAGMKGTTTLLEKIRSDFNTTSKSGTKDRVIQLRVHPNNADLAVLSPPVPIAPHTLWSAPPEPKEETEAAYQDLITKFKAQILASFDTRVTQYEEDVREKEAQRMLPGWNFCTFFVLKEGLARAFESVGLVEDALVLYDELAVGLGEFLRGGEAGVGVEGVLGIEEWTEETRDWVARAREKLRRKVRGVQRRRLAAGAGEGGGVLRIKHAATSVVGSSASTVVGDASDVGEKRSEAGNVEGSTTVHETETEYNDAYADDEETPTPSIHDRLTIGTSGPNEPPLSPYKKPYRELILANRISVFDFECYLFSRQSNLLLRLGGAHNAVVPTPTTVTGGIWTMFGSSSVIGDGTSARATTPDPGTAGAGGHAAPQTLQTGEEDLKHLTALLRRALAFVTNVGRILRQDLWNGLKVLETENITGGDVDEEEEKEKRRVMGNLVDDVVGDWMFSVCMQVLEQTEARAIPREVVWGVASRVGSPAGSPATGLQGHGGLVFPKRTSSLPSTPVVEQGSFMVSGPASARPVSVYFGSGGAGQQAQQSNPPLEELCAARGDVLVLARSLVEGFARRKGWMGEWGSDEGAKSAKMAKYKKKGWFDNVQTPGLEEISLNDDDGHGRKSGRDGREEGEEVDDEMIGIEVGCGVTSRLLKKAVESEMGFYELFEDLSEKARRHFMLGKRTKSGERVIADLAALKFHLRDYPSSAQHLEKLTTFYASDGWSLIETRLLTMYAKCLSKMNRREEYVKVLLRLLAKSTAKKMRWDWRRIAALGPAVVGRVPPTPLEEGFRIPRDDADREGAEVDEPRDVERDEEKRRKEREQEEDLVGLDVRGYVAEVVSMSDKLTHTITHPMTAFFTDISVEPFLQFLGERKDGFRLLVRFRYLLDEPIEVECVKVRIVSMTGGPQAREIWMSSEPAGKSAKGVEKVTLGLGLGGREKIWVETNQNVPGTYMVDQIMVAVGGHMSFVHEVLGKSTPATPVALTASNAAAAIEAAKRKRVRVWSHPKALRVEMRVPEIVYLDRGRRVEFVVTTGWNDVSWGEVSVKSATAGLRIMMREVEVVMARERIKGEVVLEGGKVKLKNVPAGQEVVLRVPYSVEREVAEVGARIEVSYETGTGSWVFAESMAVTVALPLAVNVQDVFKGTVLFSKFQVSTALEVPLVIVGAELDGEGTGFVAEAAGGVKRKDEKGVVRNGGWLVVGRQAGQFVYRIRRRDTDAAVGTAVTSGVKKKALQLRIAYRSLDEEIFGAVRRELENALVKEGLEGYMWLLLGHLKNRLDSRGAEEMEVVGVTEEVRLGSWMEWGWGEVLEAVGCRGERERVGEWLKRWWEGDRGDGEADEEGVGRIIKLNIRQEEDGKETGITRSLIIPVEVPRVDVICTAELKMFPGDKESKATNANALQERILIVGETVPAELRIWWSTGWAGSPPPMHLSKSPAPGTTTPSSSSSSSGVEDEPHGREGLGPDDAEQEMEFTYYLTQPPLPPVYPGIPQVASSQAQASAAGVGDTWLISGRRRGTFTIPLSALSATPPGATPIPMESVPEDKKMVRVQLLLIPLRTGMVGVPGVEVKAVGVTGPGLGGGEKQQQWTPVVETDYVNSGECVGVVRDVRSVTVGVGGGGVARAGASGTGQG